ncbi:Serine 3-dehydrogenase [Methanimicrococcus sp. At1]|uniref:Serine 3-dehydrogenase n=1 Tax=Methanimicrococcus hacksteinii TaxID=3028293 RepID=A0ABU3VQA0_9EURY|nr:SDR family oxidoreductase [Methanimicrococcus sp. At1]MDV0445341.1 Serine 3-dehydrogenase [Methanimicrococcus sp. At1]
MKQTALITGATGGIGRELSKIFAKNGYDLILTARNEEKLAAFKMELENEYDIFVGIIAKDLTQNDAAKEIFDLIELDDLQIDILVNNAGFGDYGRYDEADWNKQHDMIQVNILALTQLTRLLLPKMLLRENGRILNIASVAAFAPGPYMSVYYASKAFVLSFSEALATELKGKGVTVTAVCPGPTKSGFEEAAGPGTEKLFNSMKNAAAEEVAAFAYQALMKGKVVAVQGFGNKVLVFAERFLPRSVVRKYVYRLQGEG